MEPTLLPIPERAQPPMAALSMVTIRTRSSMSTSPTTSLVCLRLLTLLDWISSASTTLPTTLSRSFCLPNPAPRTSEQLLEFSATPKVGRERHAVGRLQFPSTDTTHASFAIHLEATSLAFPHIGVQGPILSEVYPQKFLFAPPKTTNQSFFHCPLNR
ncbi:hypothetical protein BKA80DRAFT_259024 [Phyllosticta citrichinensis]